MQGMRADGGAGAAAAASALLDDYDSSKEMAVEMRCRDAFAAILHFERTHCLTLQVTPLSLVHVSTHKVMHAALASPLRNSHVIYLSNPKMELEPCCCHCAIYCGLSTLSCNLNCIMKKDSSSIWMLLV